MTGTVVVMGGEGVVAVIVVVMVVIIAFSGGGARRHCSVEAALLMFRFSFATRPETWLNPARRFSFNFSAQSLDSNEQRWMVAPRTSKL